MANAYFNHQIGKRKAKTRAVLYHLDARILSLWTSHRASVHRAVTSIKRKVSHPCLFASLNHVTVHIVSTCICTENVFSC